MLPHRKDVDARHKAGHDGKRLPYRYQPPGAGNRHVFSTAFLGANVALMLSNSSTFTPFLRMM
jgi:hypothetical protein